MLNPIKTCKAVWCRDRVPVIWWSLGAALLAAMISLVILWPGVPLSPDGWAYWEGSVSLLEGNGYVYFGGEAIKDFPPLYSLYLAGVQALVGVHGAALVLATLMLSGLITFVWCCLAGKLTQGSPGAGGRTALAMISIACFTGVQHTLVLSEGLYLVFLAVLLVGVIGEKAFSWPAVLFLMLSCTALLLTRHIGVVVLPGLFLVALFSRKGDQPAIRGLRALGLVLLPLILWKGVGLLLGQAGSHHLGVQPHYRPMEYVQQVLADLPTQLLPQVAHPFQVLALVVSLLVMLGLGAHLVKGRENEASGSIRMLLIVGGATVGTYAVFNLTYIHDPLTQRFLWFLPLSLFALLPVCGEPGRFPVLRWTSLVLLALIALSQINQARVHVLFRLHKPRVPNVNVNDTLDPDRSGIGRWLCGRDLVYRAPPDFDWQERYVQPILEGATP